MAISTDQCPLCGTNAEVRQTRSGLLVKDCNNCGTWTIDNDRKLKEMVATQGERLRDVGRVVCERRAKGLTEPFFIRFDKTSPAPGNEYVTIDFDDLVQDTPSSVPKRIERSFVHLARGCSTEPAGRLLPCSDLLFARTPSESNYFRDAMIKYEWLEQQKGGGEYVVTPPGWRYFAEWNKASNLRSPAFLAMWFGGKEATDRERMASLFEDAIRPACCNCGWNVERVDSTEHNDSIIDRVMDMIRVAPFVIADLSDGNQGVYYEAGFARGLARDVIYLVREGTQVHFDLSGVNHVRWQTPDDLRVKLENRILGTMGRGPHPLDPV